jgi:hypothetical protein
MSLRDAGHIINKTICIFPEECTSLPPGTNRNLIHEEIKRRLNSSNVCYHSAHSLLSSRLLSRNIKIRIHKTISLPVVLYGCETWSLSLRQGHRLRVFENRVLRRIFGPKRNEVTGGWRKLHNEDQLISSFHNSVHLLTLFHFSVFYIYFKPERQVDNAWEPSKPEIFFLLHEMLWLSLLPPPHLSSVSSSGTKRRSCSKLRK